MNSCYSDVACGGSLGATMTGHILDEDSGPDTLA